MDYYLQGVGVRGGGGGGAAAWLLHSIPNNGHERSWGAPGGRFCELSLGIMECFTEAASRTILAVVSAQVRG